MVDFSSIKSIEIPEGDVKSIIANGVILWQKDEGGLPSQYQQVEYIESDGYQYINTGIKAKKPLRIELGASVGTLTRQDVVFIGAWNKSNGIIIGGYWQSSTSPYGIATAGSSGWEYTNTAMSSTLLDFIYDSLTKEYTAGSNTITTQRYMNDYYSDIHLFHNNGDIGANSKYIRISYCKIYSNNELVRYFVACYRKLDNVIGMYDLITKTFYTNNGSGTFTKGGNI